MIQKYVEQTNFKREEPLVDKEDVDAYKKFGATKMIDALTLLARQIPGRYPAAYVYMAEKGIQLHLEGLARVAAPHEQTMKELDNLTAHWVKQLGETRYYVRPGHPDYKAIDVCARDIRSASVGPNADGWVTDAFISAGIAALRHEVFYECVVVEAAAFQMWLLQCKDKGELVDFRAWGSLECKARRVLIFNDDPEGNGHHWLFFTADPATQSYSIINSQPTQNAKTEEARKIFYKFLKDKVFDIDPRIMDIWSNEQADAHNCGIWVIKNAVAVINAETGEEEALQRALTAVSVDILDRQEIAARIFHMVNSNRQASSAKVQAIVQGMSPLATKQVNDFVNNLHSLKKD
jgi:hypothetical protein